MGIDNKEWEHFEYIYSQVEPNFPKMCPCCGIVYQNELDYNNKTTEIEGVMGGLELDLIGFIRNCQCGSSLALNIDPSRDNYEDWGDFLEYLSQRSRNNNTNITEEILNVRKEYNEEFLPKKIYGV